MVNSTAGLNSSVSILSHLFPYLELERKLSNDSIKEKTVIASGQSTRKKFLILKRWPNFFKLQSVSIPAI